MTNIIRIPKRFFEDHRERFDEEFPAVINETKTHYFISRDDEHLWNLEADCEYTIEMHSLGEEWYRQNFGFVMSARATLKAIKETVF